MHTINDRDIRTKNLALRPDLLLAGCAFTATMVTCVSLRPEAMISHDGLSYYGNFKSTVLPYSIGLASTAYFLLRSAAHLATNAKLKPLASGVQLMAFALLGIIATPSLSHIRPVQDIHDLFATTVFAVQGILSLLYLGQLTNHKAKLDHALVATQFAAVIVAALSFHKVPLLSLMLPAQCIAALSWGYLLIRATSRSAL